MPAAAPPRVDLLAQGRYVAREIADLLARRFEAHGPDLARKTVFLKVSLVFPVRDPTRTLAVNTHPEVVLGTVEALLRGGARRVLVGEGEVVGPARYAFEVTGLGRALRSLPPALRERVEPCYLDEGQRSWIAPPEPILPGLRLDYPRAAREADLFVSMPKIKTNLFAGLSLAAKNGMGLVGSRTRWAHHGRDLPGLIADIFRVRPPDLVVADAIVAGEGQGPIAVTPWPLGLLVVGENAVATDVVCASLLGRAPSDVPYLALLADRGYGPGSLDGIQVEPPRMLEERRRAFRAPDARLDTLAGGLEAHVGSACACGAPAFLRHMLDAYREDPRGRRFLGRLRLVVGEGAPVSPDVRRGWRRRCTLAYGRCTREHRRHATWYRGCPPRYQRAMMLFPFFTTLGPVPWARRIEVGTYLRCLLLHAGSALMRTIGPGPIVHG